DTLFGSNTNIFLGGAVAIDARLEGSVSEPQLGGEVRVNRLSISSLDPQFVIEEGNGRILLSGDKVILESFTALANEGNINANGTLTLAQFRPEEWRFGLNAGNIIVFYQGAHVTLSGDLTLTGAPQGQLLSGTVTIPQAEYTTDFDFESLAS